MLYPTLVFPDGKSAMPEWLKRGYGEQATYMVTSSEYWANVPTAYRDRDRYAVTRTISITLGRRPPVSERIKILAPKALVWMKEITR